jgi:glyoxylase-like metal-dependent hydrolase (beta-lactamase superfamily II)
VSGHRDAGPDSNADAPFRRVTDHLYVYEDACLVYILIDAEHALLVDSGSGDVVDRLAELGVKQVDWVLHTHHHRDGCWNDYRLVENGARLGVPEREAHLFEEVEDYWQHLTVYDNYYLGSDVYSLPRNVPIAARLTDYGTFSWRHYDFQVVPTPGHTQGSIALLTDIDGVTVAFTGDLVASAGHLWQVHALQWQYGGGWGDAAGIQSTALSLAEVLDCDPDLLLPSHGSVIHDPPTVVRELLGRLRVLYWYLDGSAFLSQPSWLITDRQLNRLTTHLWMNRASLANSYTIIADDGKGLFLDYGYPSLSHFSGNFRFARHSLRELFDRGGLTQPDVLIPSHYHDDHIAGAPLLQREFGVRIWAHEVFADILRRPDTYSLPCLLSEPLEVERDLRDGERFEWSDFQFEIRHTPGHTYYASSLLMELDGLRVVLAGDNLHVGRFGPMLGGPIYRNCFTLGDFVASVQQLCEWAPDLLLTGHSGAIQIEPAWLDAALRRARDLDDMLQSLVAIPHEAGFALDPHWVRIIPYQIQMSHDGHTEFCVNVRNYSRQPVTAIVQILAPDGWRVEPGQQEMAMQAAEEGRVNFALTAPPEGMTSSTQVICATVDLKDGARTRRFGPVAEALIRLPDHTF